MGDVIYIKLFNVHWVISLIPCLIIILTINGETTYMLCQEGTGSWSGLHAHQWEGMLVGMTTQTPSWSEWTPCLWGQGSLRELPLVPQFLWGYEGRDFLNENAYWTLEDSWSGTVDSMTFPYSCY